MQDVMIDLETLDTGPDCVILTLGAVRFNPWQDEINPDNCIYLKPDVDEQIALGRRVNEGTMQWWAQQPPDVRDDAISDTDRISLEEFSKQLNKIVANADRIWAQGPVFDIVILENLYRQIGKPAPWQYYSIRDSRTLLKALGDNRAKGRNQAHNAVADCIYQIQSIHAAVVKYNLTEL